MAFTLFLTLLLWTVLSAIVTMEEVLKKSAKRSMVCASRKFFLLNFYPPINLQADDVGGSCRGEVHLTPSKI